MLDLSKRRISGSILRIREYGIPLKPRVWKLQVSIQSRNFDFFNYLLFAHGASYFDLVPFLNQMLEGYLFKKISASKYMKPSKFEVHFR